MAFLKRYCFILSLPISIGGYVNAQTNTYINDEQATVTIIGDPIQTNNANDFINSNNTLPPAQAPPSPQYQQRIQSTNYIEPTFENGFHIRFEVGSAQTVNNIGSSAFSSSSGASGKTKKHTVKMTERSFNMKKRIKSWLPKRKRKYRPHLCGRF